MAKLLIVDDEKNIRQSLAHFLTGCGHEASVAESSSEALELLAGGQELDLVLSDWRMAEMNGLELLGAIKEKYPDLVVILMTAYGTIDNAVAAMKGGAYDYLTKPFSVDQIQHVVERALEVRDLRTQNRALLRVIEGVPLVESRNRAF